MHRIMVVDDDPTSLAIIKALLEDEYVLLPVRSGQQALGTLNSENLPDLILLDMVMPGLDGLELLNLIQQKETCRDIPVIFLTGEDYVEAEVNGYRAGASDFLLKPVNPYLLKLKIQRQLTYRTLKRENVALRHAVSVLTGT